MKKMLPVIKWAGGKRQLLEALRQDMPNDIGTYVEPFFGSGAMFFDIVPQKSIINDYNPELVNMYIQIRDNLPELLDRLDSYQREYLDREETRKETYYYDKREQFNNNILSERLSVEDAALMIFLNKTCYNGLYRVNTSGLFNTPFGKHKKIKLYDKDNIILCSKALQKAKICQGDFENACKNLRKNDFVYFDSPYFKTFDTYQAGGFPKEEHERLAKLFDRLSQRGIYCMLSNSDTDFIRKLYAKYNIETIPVMRMINCDGKNRTGTEIIVRNY